MTKKKETKTAPPPIDAEVEGRVTMETVVTDGPTGMARLSALVRKLLVVRPGGTRPPPNQSA